MRHVVVRKKQFVSDLIARWGVGTSADKGGFNQGGFNQGGFNGSFLRARAEDALYSGLVV